MIREVTCNFRLYLKMGRTSVKPRWKHLIFTSNYRCLHTGVPYNTTYGWNRPIIKAQCSCLPIPNSHFSGPCYELKHVRSMFPCVTFTTQTWLNLTYLYLIYKYYYDNLYHTTCCKVGQRVGSWISFAMQYMSNGWMLIDSTVKPL